MAKEIEHRIGTAIKLARATADVIDRNISGKRSGTVGVMKVAHLLVERTWLLHGLFPGFGSVFARSFGPHILESPLTRAHKKGSTNRTKEGVTGVLRRVGRDWEG
jgi:hypothetical protein